MKKIAYIIRVETKQENEMTRDEMMEWLETCPDHKWEIVHEGEGHVRVLLCFDEEEEDV